MAIDLKDEDGELDRGKVNGELEYILSHVPDAAPSIRQQIINLIDEVVEVAWMNGHDF